MSLEANMNKIQKDRAYRIKENRIYSQKGFTLIEILIVLALLMALLSMAVPTLHNSLSEYRLQMAARQVQKDMLWAREQTVKNRQHHSIYFHQGSNRYDVRGRGSQIIYIQYLPSGVVINSTTFLVRRDLSTFGIDGRSSNPVLGGTITLRNERGHFRHVILSRNGRVRISKTPPGSPD
ncbi:GspH/FimT family pseudopilin [Heliorestis convoluta]|nr:GspH/FimT family protein [Heliorestis convoluta]